MTMATTATNSPTEIDPKARFFRYFQHEVTALQEEMLHLVETGVSGGERSDGVEHCLAGISRLSNEVQDNSSRIPAYDIRTYNDAIKALSEKLQKTRASFAPRPKFTFKSAMRTRSSISSPKKEQRGRLEQRLEDLSGPKSAPAAMQDIPFNGGEDAVENEDSRADTIRTSGSGPGHAVSITGHAGSYVPLPKSTSQAKSAGAVSDIRRCIVNLSIPASEGSPFASLTLKNITESLVVCGNISGPTHVTGIERSVIVVSSRQLRMHDCKNCDVYLHCSSRPIIERCEAIRFASLPDAYMLESLRETANKFDQVDDFNWLKAEHSPHWRVLQTEERMKDSMWNNIVPDEANVRVDGILEAIKVIG